MHADVQLNERADDGTGFGALHAPDQPVLVGQHTVNALYTHAIVVQRVSMKSMRKETGMMESPSANRMQETSHKKLCAKTIGCYKGKALQ